MRLITALMTLSFVLATSVASYGQQQTGEIFGRLTDASRAVLPGATVTVAGPSLLQPRPTVTSESGTYRVPELPIGTYAVTFELPGFRSVVMTDIRVTIGFRAQVNAELAVSSVQERVTVSGESPLIDTRETGTKTSFDVETLQNLPSARDPWVMLERTPSITMDRANVGGTQSGQQSGYVSRGANTTNNKWSMDGVDITDMSATGSSPIYYDFDMLEEMQVTTGGQDVTQQTGGVGINLVTRSGNDTLRGSSRFYWTDEAFQSDNVSDDLKRQNAGSGAPIQNIKDYGVEIGGPIRKGRAWFWGSYGKQDIKAGIVGFFLPDARCQAMKAGLARRSVRVLDQRRPRVPRQRRHRAQQLQLESERRANQEQPAHVSKFLGGEIQERPGCVGYASDRNHLPPGPGAKPFWRLRLDHRAEPGVESERSARHQRSVARRCDVGARGQQLRTRLPRRRTRKRAAFIRNHHQCVGPVVPARGSVHPPNEQRRRDDDVLRAGRAGWRSCLQSRLSLAHRSGVLRGAFWRQHGCRLQARCGRPKRGSSATR